MRWKHAVAPADPPYPALYWCAEKPAVYFRYECNKGYCVEAGQRVYHHEARKSRAWAETINLVVEKYEGYINRQNEPSGFRDGDYAAAVKVSSRIF